MVDEVGARRDKETQLKARKQLAYLYYDTFKITPIPLRLPGEKMERDGKEMKATGKEARGYWARKKVLDGEGQGGEKGSDKDYAHAMMDKCHHQTKMFNLGIFPGHNYADIDVDDTIARELALDILPETTWMFGRVTAGSHPTHYLYKLKPSKHKPKFKSFKAVEYRTGYSGLTVVPPSLHYKPDSAGNEVRLRWHTDPNTVAAVEVDAQELYKAVKLLAVCTYLCTPGVLEAGDFHNTSVCIAGGFYRMELSLEQAKNAMKIVAGYTGQTVEARMPVVIGTYEKGKAGGSIKGFRGLKEYTAKVGVLDQLFRVLRIDASEEFDDDEFSDGGEVQGIAALEDTERVIKLLTNCYAILDDKPLRVVDTTLPVPNSILGYRSFEALYSPFKALSEDGKKQEPITKQWSEDEMRKFVIGDTYLPGGERIVESDLRDSEGNAMLEVNLYYNPPRDVDRGVGKRGFFDDHMEFLFPESDARELFLDVMAFWVQKPAERIQWVPLLMSREHGIGKSWIESLMLKLIHESNVGAAKIADLVDEKKEFNAFLFNKLFCCVHEVREGTSGKFTMTEKLKHIITEGFQLVNTKYGKEGGRQVYTNFLFLSNHPDALAVDEFDRRLWVHEITAGKRDEEYYIKLWGGLEDKVSLDQVWTFLMERDLGLFNPGKAPPVTKAKESMIRQNMCEEERLVRSVMEDTELGVEIATFNQVKRIAGYYNELGVEIRPKVFQRFLTEVIPHLKTGRSDNRIKWQGGLHTVWILGEKDDWEGEPENDKIRGILEKNEAVIDFLEGED